MLARIINVSRSVLTSNLRVNRVPLACLPRPMGVYLQLDRQQLLREFETRYIRTTDVEVQGSGREVDTTILLRVQRDVTSRSKSSDDTDWVQ